MIFAPLFDSNGSVPADGGAGSQAPLGASSRGGASAFVTTQWSVVLAVQGQSPAAEEALENLCRTYWRPLYGFVRRQGYTPEEAQDLTQGFFALLLERKDFESVRREKGRLRSYLLASLKHFMANERRNAAALKRGAGQRLIALDGLSLEGNREFESTESLSADRIYDRRWALTVLERVFARLREESQGSDNAPLRERLNELLSDEPDRPSQAEIAREFGMTENAVKQAFYRLRQRYRQLLREEIAHVLCSDIVGYSKLLVNKRICLAPRALVHASLGQRPRKSFPPQPALQARIKSGLGFNQEARAVPVNRAFQR